MNTTRNFIPQGRTALYTLLLATLLISGCRGTPPRNLGVESGQLKPCPETPNCVSTRPDADPEHRMEPIPFRGSREQAMEAIAETVDDAPRTEVVQKDDDYLRAEFTSRIFRFVDDVEFYIDEKAKLIHFRSASRLGSSDLGVNRDRMTGLAKDLKAKLGD